MGVCQEYTLWQEGKKVGKGKTAKCSESTTT